VTLLAVPNLSEGTGALAPLFGDGVLDVHADPDHNRTVVTMPADLGALLGGIAAVIERIDLTQHAGVHPRVGAVDVAPIVYTTPRERGAAIALALVLADEIGRLGVPVHLYGQLGRPRAEVRREPGPPAFGPPEHPTAGHTLVTARPPLIAFNVFVDASLEQARAIAAEVRRLPGVVALGVPTRAGVQVTVNLEGETTPAQLTAAVAARAPVLGTELVGLAPRGTEFPPGTEVRYID
jgi:glutamate formiminotransferase